MRKAIVVVVLGAAALLGASCKSSRGCKVEDQCGRLVDKGVDRSCTEIKCVPNACDKAHFTMLGHQFCDKMPASALTASAGAAPSTSK